MKCFILAGGFATRLWPLTEKRAKPLLPLAGRPLISHLLAKIPGDIPVTVSTNAAFAEGFTQWIRQEHRPAMKLLVEDTSHDDHKLGALGAVAEWLEQEKIAEDVLLLTGDNYLGFSMDRFLASYKEGTTLLAAHDIQDRKRASAFGTVIADQEKDGGREVKRVRAFAEKPAEPESTLVSTGCSILPSRVLPVLRAFAKDHPDNVGSLFEELLRQGEQIECFTFAEPWLDIGSFPAYLAAHRLVVGQQVIADPTAQLRKSRSDGSVCIGPRSIVEESELTDSIIFEDCHITDCSLTECVVDAGCTLRGVDLRGKMLRAGTRLILT